jgi:hypothetical protein
MSIGQTQSRTSADSENVQQRLSQEFAKVEAYQHNRASIRVRIFDERFRSLPKLDRIDLIEPFLGRFAEDIQQQLIFILCLAPGEETDPSFWALNREFEDPATAAEIS